MEKHTVLTLDLQRNIKLLDRLPQSEYDVKGTGRSYCSISAER